MNVDLLISTPLAREVLIFTKNTRLSMSGIGFNEVVGWSDERKAHELEYMRNTIQSSWEFVDYTFAITGVSRAFTHQLVRHRVGTSFAQQSQRAVDMTGFEYITGPSIDEVPDLDEEYDGVMRHLSIQYARLIKGGAAVHDARGILPTNISTNIIFKANLRTLHEMALKRLCVKAQGEFQDVFRAIRTAVVREHPWTADFLHVQCAWNGTCLFPSLPMAQCPVKPSVFNPETARAYDGNDPATLVQIRRIHDEHRSEVRPSPQLPLDLPGGAS